LREIEQQQQQQQQEHHHGTREPTSRLFNEAPRWTGITRRITSPTHQLTASAAQHHSSNYTSSVVCSRDKQQENPFTNIVAHTRQITQLRVYLPRYRA